MHTAAALALALSLVACSATDVGLLDAGEHTRDAGTVLRDAGAHDAGVGDAQPHDASTPRLELGTGADGFVPLVDGELIELVRGPQGGEPIYGYHVWIGLRAVGFEPRAMDVAFTTEVEATEERLAESRYQVNLERAPDGDGWVTFGLRMLLSDCCKATHTPLVLRAMIADARGQTAEDTRHVIGGLCNAGLPEQPIDACAQ